MKISTNNGILDLAAFTLEDSSGTLKLFPLNHSTPKTRIYLKITNACNAQCSYCYQGKHSGEVPYAINKYKALIQKIVYSNSEIVIFGGEPLMEANLDNINFIFSLNREKDFLFFSNGYFDDTVRDFILSNRTQIQCIIVSIDGLGKVHNTRRPFGNKDGFSRIISNIEFLSNSQVSSMLQINVDRSNATDVGDIIQFLYRKFGTTIPFVLNKVLHTELEIPTSEFLELYAMQKKIYRIPNLLINSALVNKMRDLLINQLVSCRRCDICNTKIYNFQDNSIYCCPQKSDSIVGTFDFDNEFVDQNLTNCFSAATNKRDDMCKACELRYLCDFGCLDDNTALRADCKNHVIAAIKSFMNNAESFLEELT